MLPLISWLPKRHARKVVAIISPITIALLLVLYLLTRARSPPPTLQTIPWIPTCLPSDTRIAKATILYTPASERSLALHSVHNAAFGYEMHVLRTPIVRGFANILLWLQHLIVSEMLKNVEERMEWIVYVPYHQYDKCKWR
jgi:hypothetical protein